MNISKQKVITIKYYKNDLFIVYYGSNSYNRHEVVQTFDCIKENALNFKDFENELKTFLRKLKLSEIDNKSLNENTIVYTNKEEQEKSSMEKMIEMLKKNKIYYKNDQNQNSIYGSKIYKEEYEKILKEYKDRKEYKKIVNEKIKKYNFNNSK